MVPLFRCFLLRSPKVSQRVRVVPLQASAMSLPPLVLVRFLWRFSWGLRSPVPALLKKPRRRTRHVQQSRFPPPELWTESKWVLWISQSLSEDTPLTLQCCPSPTLSSVPRVICVWLPKCLFKVFMINIFEGFCGVGTGFEMMIRLLIPLFSIISVSQLKYSFNVLVLKIVSS